MVFFWLNINWVNWCTTRNISMSEILDRFLCFFNEPRNKKRIGTYSSEYCCCCWTHCGKYIFYVNPNPRFIPEFEILFGKYISTIRVFLGLWIKTWSNVINATKILVELCTGNYFSCLRWRWFY